MDIVRLEATEFRLLDDLFDMHGSYLLGFSNRAPGNIVDQVSWLLAPREACPKYRGQFRAKLVSGLFLGLIRLEIAL